jgi:hypothetical protein
MITMTTELVKTIEQRAEKFAEVNLKSSTEDRRMANWLIIKTAMLIGASIMLEQQAKEQEALDEETRNLFRCPCGEDH